MDERYDVVIIGAGPCGIACTKHLLENGRKVVLVEVGKDCKDRLCKVDMEDKCTHCVPCNVMAGFGGCLHYGDAVKVSRYPSGKNLYDKIGDDEYHSLEEIALNEWDLTEADFVNGQIEDLKYDFNVKSYPVSVLSGVRLKGLLNKWRFALEEQDRFSYFNDCAKDVVPLGYSYEVLLMSGRRLVSDNVVIAVGRKGLEWIGNICNKYEIVTDKPHPSVGVRFIIPSRYLVKIGRKHPDLKIKTERDGIKYKSFCFCGGEHGGRIKHLNYGAYTLLDGHVLSEHDEMNKYGNFALLRHISNDVQCADDLIKAFRDLYQNNLNGEPVCEKFLDFKTRRGKLYKLYDAFLDEYCDVAKDVFVFIADVNSVELDLLMKDILVEGPEIEGMWARVHSNAFFLVDGRGMYVGGDCAGETQGAFQAYIIGLRIADGIIRKLEKGRENCS